MKKTTNETEIRGWVGREGEGVEDMENEALKRKRRC